MRIKVEESSPVEAAIKIIGGKYKTIILWNLIDKTLRFSELQKKVPCATAKMLTQQLRELEKNGLINRKVYCVVPPKVEYSLTDFGKELNPLLQEVNKFGIRILNQK